MKLPFSVGTRLAYRVLIPGLLLAVFFYPLSQYVLTSFGYSLSKAIYFGGAIPGFGWLLLLGDMPMYMFLEGRSGWPRWARKWGIRRERRRLVNLLRRARKAERSRDGSMATELMLRVYQFPLENDRPAALYPTRLGNLLTEYERYPNAKYGADGVFYWYRLWLIADKEVRNEIDEKQALSMAQSTSCMSSLLGHFYRSSTRICSTSECRSWLVS